MMRAFRLPMLVGAVLVGGLLIAGPAKAGKLVDAAPDLMRGYAEQAGYLLASIPKCGGDAEEEQYFRDLARDNLLQIGADEDDLGFLDFHMDQAAAAAKPKTVIVPKTAAYRSPRNSSAFAPKSNRLWKRNRRADVHPFLSVSA